MADYLVAVSALVRECVDLRSYLQAAWRQSAYKGLNTAVAGAVSTLAVAMIRRSASEIFVDFPDHDPYESIISTLDPARLGEDSDAVRFQAIKLDPNLGPLMLFKEIVIDIRERLMMHTYRDLTDFLDDFRKTHSGKPTKRMLTEIRDWDPEFDLQKATDAERIRWRRSYTINWLYDLVNLFSSVVVQRNAARNETHILEAVDWSPSGPWHKHRRLFGLNAFAGVVTSLALQKPGVDVRKRILPHHVFHLQSIVDAFTACRGWSVASLMGHVVNPPPQNFRPLRDVDLFLGRGNRPGIQPGFLQEVHDLQSALDARAKWHPEPNLYRDRSEVLEALRRDFSDWLGGTNGVLGFANIPPSRRNGLWEYSPFLCGVGLMESLELAYLAGMSLWEGLCEPTTLIH